MLQCCCWPAEGSYRVKAAHPIGSQLQQQVLMRSLRYRRTACCVAIPSRYCESDARPTSRSSSSMTATHSNPADEVYPADVNSTCLSCMITCTCDEPLRVSASFVRMPSAPNMALLDIKGWAFQAALDESFRTASTSGKRLSFRLKKTWTAVIKVSSSNRM